MKVGEKVSRAEMENRVGKQIAKIGLGKAKSHKWINIDGSDVVRIA